MKNNLKLVLFFIILSISASAMYWQRHFNFLKQVRDSLGKGDISVKGKVVSDVFSFSRDVFVDLGGYKAKVLLDGAGRYNISWGDNVYIRGGAFVPYEFKNPGCFSVERYLNLKNVAFYIKPKSFVRVGTSEGILLRLHNLREYLVDRALKLPVPLNMFVISVIFGERRLLPADVKASFYRLGLGHILAVSGFHFGVILGSFYVLIWMLLKFVNVFINFPYIIIPKRLAYVFSVVFAFVLLVLTGGHLSAARAAVMFIIFAVLKFFDVESSLLRTTVVTFFIFLIYNPFFIFDVGFQLTFSAMFLISVILKKFEENGDFVKFIAVSILVPLGLAPIAAFHFHRIYPVGFVANMFFIPVFSFLMVISIIVFVADLLGMGFLSYILSRVLSYLFGVMKAVSDYPGFEIIVTRSEIVLFMCIAYAVLFLFLRHRLFLLVSLCFALIFVKNFVFGPKSYVVFFDMGRYGNANLIKTGGRNILVNAGGIYKRGSYELLSALLWQDVKDIDLLVLTGKTKSESAYIKFLKDSVDVKKVVVKPVFKFKNLIFSRYKRLCRLYIGSICRVTNGSLYIDGRAINVYKSGMVKLVLEER